MSPDWAWAEAIAPPWRSKGARFANSWIGLPASAAGASNSTIPPRRPRAGNRAARDDRRHEPRRGASVGFGHMRPDVALGGGRPGRRGPRTPCRNARLVAQLVRCPLPRGRDLRYAARPGGSRSRWPAPWQRAAASQARFRGRPLVDVLEEFQRRGLHLIFSSAVVGQRSRRRRRADGGRSQTPPRSNAAAARTESRGRSAAVRSSSSGGRAPKRLRVDSPLPRLIEDIVVIPSRREVVERNVEGTRHVDATAAALVPVPGSDPSRMVSLLPGVATTEASATFHARGSASRDAVPNSGRAGALRPVSPEWLSRAHSASWTAGSWIRSIWSPGDSRRTGETVPAAFLRSPRRRPTDERRRSSSWER